MRGAELRVLFARLVGVCLATTAGTLVACGGRSVGSDLFGAEADEDVGDAAAGDKDSAPGPADGGHVTDAGWPKPDAADSGFDGGDCNSMPIDTDAGFCAKYALVCGVDVPDGALPTQFCTRYCGGLDYRYCNVASRNAGRTILLCNAGCAIGRRPFGLEDEDLDDRGELGRFFARAAHLEAASVYAFRILERELEEHGAPEAMRGACRAAARDEVRHARAVRHLAARFGGSIVAPRVRASETRSLLDIAIENAVEGCVHETFSALQAAWQARTASDPDIAREMAVIAQDEARHAELAWWVARWAMERLDAASCARVEEAMRCAVHQLLTDPPAAPNEVLAVEAGLPRLHEARALVQALHAALWGSEEGGEAPPHASRRLRA